ncbi:jerky protein homolog-like [Neodiprion pinetum]|uniref:jerky protein homolog-like n=1 Tax=Neodiprion pinetum TaxID=441929 RepID=UPI001EDDE121|nr:jerky protein homolog-like [Neodiprion pinetum]
MSSDKNNNSVKRKQPTAVPVSVKVNALKELSNGTPKNVIAHNLNVTEQTVKQWEKNKKKFDNLVKEYGDELPEVKRMRKIDNDYVDMATWFWFKEKRAAGVPVQGTHVQLQAKIFHQKMGAKNKFLASNGWLYKWQQRHKIRNKKICGEKLSADTAAADEYKSQFKDFVIEEGLSLDEVFNCDESPLNYKMLPSSTLTAASEAGAFGIKEKKERVTIMACSNASGTLKLPLVLIGKSAKPRAIKNLKMLPVYYKSQKSAWMTSGLFKEWFEDAFVPAVSKFLAEKGLKKAVLFVDNCAAHPRLSKGSSLLDSLKSVSIKEVIFWIADSWNKVLPDTLRKSWSTLWPLDSTSQSEGTPSSDESSDTAGGTEILDEFCEVMKNHGGLSNVNGDDIRSWFHSDNTLNPTDILSDEEIIDIINENIDPLNIENITTQESCDILHESINSNSPKVSTTEVIQAVETLTKYCDDCNLSSQNTTLFELRELSKSQVENLNSENFPPN